MLEQILDIESETLITAGIETIQMLGWALFFGAILGIPLGFILVLTRKGGIKDQAIVYAITNSVVNIVRSVPFIILLVAIAPFTRLVVGTRIGIRAAIVPLVFYIAPYLARLIESSLLEVKPNIIEAANAMGASTFQIIRYFMLPEAKASLILAFTTGTIGLLGATTMAGTIGGGGIGDLALTYGYQRFNSGVMVVTVIILILFVQCLQTAGNYFAKKIRTHD